MKPAMLEQAVAAGRAPTLALLMERGHHVGECVAAFPSVTPVCSASIATGAAPDRHLIPSMNWYHRGEERYVEYGTSFKASQAFGFKRSLTDTIYNMNAEHLSRGDADGVRVARRRRRPHRRHDLPHVPRPPPARGDDRDGAHADRLDRLQASRSSARASSSTPTSSPRAAPAAARSSGCRASATSTPAASAEYLVEHDLFDFLLLSLPDNDTHSHKHGPGRPGDVAGRRRPADRAPDARRRRPGRVPRGPRGDRLLRPLAVAGRGRDRPVPRVRRLRGAAGERRAREQERPAAPRSPSARARAPRRSTCSTATPAARSSRASSARCSRSRASTS